MKKIFRTRSVGVVLALLAAITLWFTPLAWPVPAGAFLYWFVRRYDA